MFAVAFILYMAFILCYSAFAAALVYHVYKYTIPEDPSHSLVTPFIALSLIIIIISTYLFSRVPWETISLSL